MQLIDLLEYKLVKGKDFNVIQNPSANELHELLQNSYVMQNFAHIDPDDIDFHKKINKPMGNIHGIDYPLRGYVVGDNVYFVDSFEADHDELTHFLTQAGIIGPPWELKDDKTRGIPLTVDRIKNNQYAITTPPAYVDHIKEIFSIKRLKLPITGYQSKKSPAEAG